MIDWYRRRSAWPFEMGMLPGRVLSLAMADSEYAFRVAMKVRPLLLLGDGRFAVETLEIAEAVGEFSPLGFVNSLTRPKPGATIEGLPVFWIDDVPFDPAECEVVCTVVSTERLPFIKIMRSRGYRFASLVHPFSNASRRAHIGSGCIVNAGVVIGSNAVLGDYTIANRGALIGHDDQIGSCCTIGPGANIAGNVEIGDGAFIAQGAVILEGIKIGRGAVVGAGAIVLQDVRPNDMVAGIPAKIIKSGVNGL
jgi:sugar O-acyltransferase (sialic acid O-acetyltransferase NeuD family)